MADWTRKMGDDFRKAPDREAKVDALRKYMSPMMATEAAGYMLGEHHGDVVGMPGRSMKDRLLDHLEETHEAGILQYKSDDDRRASRPKGR